MSTWKMVFRWMMAVSAVIIAIGAGMSVFLYLVYEETAEAGESSAIARQRRAEAVRAESIAFQERWERDEQERENRWKQLEEESARRQAEISEEELKRPPRKKRVSRVRRWAWMSPPEKVAKMWNVPQEETIDATVTGLLRICTSEQEGSENDCLGIWQVLTNIRNRSCNRGYVNLITECDDDGETVLSVMRRASRRVVGIVPARYARQRWISQMTTECDMPESYPETVKRHCRRGLEECAQGIWEKRHRHRCEETVRLARGLVSGTDARRITGARVIAWGGRCEEPRGACDDPVACSRGLARVPNIESMDDRPANAFWYRSDEIDPLCVKMGFGSEEMSNRQGG